MNKTENDDSLTFLNIDESLYRTRIGIKYKNRKKYQPIDPRMIRSFIPGTIVDILVSDGQKVEKGDEIVSLEAMKMQNMLKSAVSGKVKKIHVKAGDKVARGTLLIELE